jgi:hypothetical protein
MRDDLTIGEGAVDPCSHRAKIILPHLRIDRGGRSCHSVKQSLSINEITRDLSWHG